MSKWQLNGKIFLLFCLLTLCAGFGHAQVEHVHFRMHYVINIAQLDTAFSDNADKAVDLRSWLEDLATDSTATIRSVRFKGTASPDGGYDFNRWLCVNRLRTFKEYVRTYVDLPDSVILANVSDIPWDGFREKVADTTNYVPYRDSVLSIIDEGPSLVPWFNNRRIDPRLLKLKKMYNGEVWDVLRSPILEDLRYGDADFEIWRLLPPLLLSAYDFPPVGPSGPAPGPIPVPVSLKETWMPRLHLKTNVIDLALLIANVAVEVDLTRHLSLTFPIYYSGVDYFVSTVKFRNFGIQPELRFWPRRSDNDGFFVGAHFGLAWYNFALNGTYRMQDHEGRTPTVGGGLAVGYRFPISADKRWRLEFSVGAGVYPLDYDLFENTPDVRDGMLMGRTKTTYIGLDQAAITFCYSFDLERFQRTYPWKGGKL